MLRKKIAYSVLSMLTLYTGSMFAPVGPAGQTGTTGVPARPAKPVIRFEDVQRRLYNLMREMTTYIAKVEHGETVRSEEEETFLEKYIDFKGLLSFYKRTFPTLTVGIQAFESALEKAETFMTGQGMETFKAAPVPRPGPIPPAGEAAASASAASGEHHEEEVAHPARRGLGGPGSIPPEFRGSGAAGSTR